MKSKKIHIVDSGLTFNLPYPLILRPQRGVDLIISFDFSARPSDSSPPFKVSKIGHSFLCVNKFDSVVFFQLGWLHVSWFQTALVLLYRQHWSSLFPRQGRILHSASVPVYMTHMRQLTPRRLINIICLK